MGENALRLLHLLKPHVRHDVYAAKTENGYRPVREKLTEVAFLRHLNGTQPVGAYVVNGDEVRAAVLDFDDHDGDLGWERMSRAVAPVLSACEGFGLRPMAFRSGGGRGVHLWFLWDDPQKARLVRCHLQNLLAICSLSEGTTGVKAGTAEIFPRQDKVEAGGLGNLIALPGSRLSCPLHLETLEPLNWETFDASSANFSRCRPVPEVADEEVGPPAYVRLAGDEETVAGALKFVPSDDYHLWVRIALALKATFGDEGFELFRQWSEKSPKFEGDEKCRKFWRDLKPNGTVGLGTVFHIARKHGWNGSPDSLIREMNAQYGVYTHGRTTEIIMKTARGGPEAIFIGKVPFFDRLAGEFIDRRTADGQIERISKALFWFRHTKASRYDRVIFDPALPPGHNGNAWNLWTGFALSPAPGDWSLLREHILENICSGDRQIYEWLLNWMALGVQQPGLVIGTVPVLIGFPGTGKGVLAHAYGRLWGEHFVAITHSEHVFGRFSGHLFARRFVFIDEGIFGGNRKDAGVIKTRITDPIIVLERKGVDAVTMKNSMIFMVASNETSVVPADKGDRRWMVLEVGTGRREDHAYFAAIQEQLSNGGYQGMLYDLLRRDLSKGPDPRRTIKTEALFEQVLLAQSAEVRYLHGILDQGRLPQNWLEGPNTTTIRALAEELHHLYRDASRINDVRLGRFIHRACPPDATGQGGKYFVKMTENGPMMQRSTWYRFPSLTDARAAFERYLNVPIAWTTVDRWQLDPDPRGDDDGVL